MFKTCLNKTKIAGLHRDSVLREYVQCFGFFSNSISILIWVSTVDRVRQTVQKCGFWKLKPYYMTWKQLLFWLISFAIWHQSNIKLFKLQIRVVSSQDRLVSKLLVFQWPQNHMTPNENRLSTQTVSLSAVICSKEIQPLRVQPMFFWMPVWCNCDRARTYQPAQPSIELTL